MSSVNLLHDYVSLREYTPLHSFRKKPRPHSVGASIVSRLTGDGINWKLTANKNLLSIISNDWDCSFVLDSCSWILRMKLIGTRSSNSFIGVYRFSILIICTKHIISSWKTNTLIYIMFSNLVIIGLNYWRTGGRVPPGIWSGGS